MSGIVSVQFSRDSLVEKDSTPAVVFIVHVLFCRMHVRGTPESKREENQLSSWLGAKNHYVQQPLQDGREWTAGAWGPAIACTQTQDSRSTISVFSMATQRRLFVKYQGDVAIMT